MDGTVGILNVGAGDIKLSFDPTNPSECVRAARIVTDMIKRGYALLVEVTKEDGTKIFQRARGFDETAQCYIIADFDPIAGEQHEPTTMETTPLFETHEASGEELPKSNRRRADKSIPASTTRAVAVGRSAGG